MYWAHDDRDQFNTALCHQRLCVWFTMEEGSRHDLNAYMKTFYIEENASKSAYLTVVCFTSVFPERIRELTT